MNYNPKFFPQIINNMSRGKDAAGWKDLLKSQNEDLKRLEALDAELNEVLFVWLFDFSYFETQANTRSKPNHRMRWA